MSTVLNEPSGVLIVDKPQGLTSHDIVGRIRRAYGTRRVGHTGTLDPLATGVLVVLVGRAAKAAEYLVADSKKYIAGLRLGITTDTEDVTGEIASRCDDIPSEERVREACASFVGKIKQVPPMYSALKVGGKKLYELAREGIKVDREARDIEIFTLEVERGESASDYVLSVECSSGTYIRTLCSDIGAALGCGGAMSSLRRVRAGGFGIEVSHTLEDIEALDVADRLALLAPVETLFEDLPRVTLPAFYERLCRSGCEIYQSKIRTDIPLGERVRICTQSGRFFALGEVREYNEGTAIKAIKTFELD